MVDIDRMHLLHYTKNKRGNAREACIMPDRRAAAVVRDGAVFRDVGRAGESGFGLGNGRG